MPLLPQSQRSRSAENLVGLLRPIVRTLPSLDAFVWSDSTGLPGSGEDNGDDLSLVISTTHSYEQLYADVDKARKALESEGTFPQVWHNLRMANTRFQVNMDSNLMARLSLEPPQISKTLQVFLSGDQSLKFSKDGISYDITLKGKQDPWDLNALYVTNKQGKRISLGTVAEMVAVSGPEKLAHYQQMRSLVLSTTLPRGMDLGEGINKFRSHVDRLLPGHYKKTWTGKAKTYQESRHTLWILLFLALCFIYAILAVQFENFKDPLLILGTVPLATAGGLGLTWLTQGSLNIYTQIGLVTLVGLITKHGILIISFANELKQDRPLSQALLQAASRRLRPILMTTAAMVIGMLPLVISRGAGHESQQAMGIVLVGGLLVGTLLTLFMLPWLYRRTSKG